MIYIFEDRKDAVLSKLFMHGLIDDKNIKIEYSGGHGNIPTIIRILIDRQRVLEDDEEFICVFMDVIPDNPNTCSKYLEYKEKYEKLYNNRILFIPIICAEYYFIKSIKDEKNIINKESVDICINKVDYKESSCIKTNEDRAICRNFEKYCKFVINRCFNNCFKKQNPYGNYYMKNSCSAECNLYKNCELKDINSKGVDYLLSYPIYPLNINSKSVKKIGIDELKIIRLRLEKEYNEFTKKLSLRYKMNGMEYMYIPLKDK